MASIFLCGQRFFGAAVLKALLQDGHRIVGAACPPQQGKRYDKLRVAALGHKIVCIDSHRLIAANIPQGTDILIAAHSHHFISAKVRGKVRLACGYHPSLLPLHRGRDAIRWAIHCGDTVTGGTVYELGDVVDGGPILAQEPVLIARNATATALWREKLFPLGIKLLLEVARQFEGGCLTRIEQDDKLASWEPAFDSAGRLYRPDLACLPNKREDL